jgi:hypothetical protein
VQVTNTSPQAMELRVLVSADTAGETSNLCAYVREMLIGFIQREYPQALPRSRSETVSPSPQTAPVSQAAQSENP